MEAIGLPPRRQSRAAFSIASTWDRSMNSINYSMSRRLLRD
jgi:hypothetical protein